jgi:hypothetical protein
LEGKNIFAILPMHPLNRGHMGDLSRQIGDDAPQKNDFPPFALKLIFTMWHHA